MSDITLAEQQFTGFTHAKKGYSLIDLVVAMGLDNSEWNDVNKESTGLSDEEITEINNYFKKEGESNE